MQQIRLLRHVATFLFIGALEAYLLTYRKSYLFMHCCETFTAVETMLADCLVTERQERQESQ